ncbi:MAG: hypothetical protein AAGA75_05745 [Cyanobacteria bacterium P01_E01_bin.6]
MTDIQQKAIAPLSSNSDCLNSNVSLPFSASSPKFQYSGKGNPCPICNRTKDADCRWNNEVCLCHSYIDQDAQIPGYIYRGRVDIWGQYFPKKEHLPKPIRARAKQEFIYQDIDGQPLVKVTRTDSGNGQKRFYQCHWNGAKWIPRLTDEVKAKLRLYKIADPINQDAIAQQKPLLIVEGEGKVELLLKKGVAATCAIGGAGKWKKYGYLNYLEDLTGVNVVLCPDRDRPGLEYCADIEKDFPNAQWLYAFPDSDEWENLPDKNGLDIADWIQQENLNSNVILATVEPKRSFSRIPIPSRTASSSEESEKKTIFQLLLKIAEQYRYFHTPSQNTYVDVEVNGIRRTFPLRHRTFRQWLGRELYLWYRKAPGSETMNQVLGLLEGQASFEGDKQDVCLRVAGHNEKVYLDLGNDAWTAIEVSADGWKIVTDYPVRFRRPNTLLPLPTPEPNGNLLELRELFNFDDDSWVLVISWLLFSFYPKYPHPILVLHGEPGSGKSYTARLLKGIVDPSKAPLIPNVSDLRNLAIQADNRWIPVFDNLSSLSIDQSDALCRISTGGGFSTRTLFENNEETVFEFIRPQIVTGIDSLASRGDLLERSLIVNLLTIPEAKRLTEAHLDAQLEKCRGRILGALLTALSQTLKNLPTIQVEKLPRMADFARFAIAAERALGSPDGSFLRAYESNRREAHKIVIESSPIAIAIQRLMDYRQRWHGTPTELLEKLGALIDEKNRKSSLWPRSPHSLGKALKRVAPDLRSTGIEVTKDRNSSNRSYTIERSNIQTS